MAKEDLIEMMGVVDEVFAQGREGGGGQVTVQEYFTRSVKLIYGLIGDTTEHGLQNAQKPHPHFGGRQGVAGVVALRFEQGPYQLPPH